MSFLAVSSAWSQLCPLQQAEVLGTDTPRNSLTQHLRGAGEWIPRPLATCPHEVVFYTGSQSVPGHEAAASCPGSWWITGSLRPTPHSPSGVSLTTQETVSNKPVSGPASWGKPTQAWVVFLQIPVSLLMPVPGRNVPPAPVPSQLVGEGCASMIHLVGEGCVSATPLVGESCVSTTRLKHPLCCAALGCFAPGETTAVSAGPLRPWARAGGSAA